MYSINVGVSLLLYYLLCLMLFATYSIYDFKHFLMKAIKIDLCTCITTLSTAYIQHLTPKTQFTRIQAIFCIFFPARCLNNSQKTPSPNTMNCLGQRLRHKDILKFKVSRNSYSRYSKPRPLGFSRAIL